MMNVRNVADCVIVEHRTGRRTDGERGLSGPRPLFIQKCLNTLITA